MKIYHLILLGILFSVVFFTTCKKGVESSEDKKLIGIVWELRSFETIAGIIEPVYPNQKYTLFINADSIAEGQSHCNWYGAKVLIQNRDISFINLVATEMVCEPPSRDGEFQLALITASTYQIRGENLQIFYNEKRNVLNFGSEK